MKSLRCSEDIVRQVIRVYLPGILILLLVLFADPVVVHAEPVRAETTARCLPSFPFRDGWLGADAAYSIPLSDGRSVWIFGDTLYGDRRVVNGNDPHMVRNNTGISRCNERGEWQIQYVIRRGGDGGSQDFFQAQVLHPHARHTWYWALDGFVHEKDLWVTLLCVRNARVKRPDGFDFETCGTDLAKVSALDADPQKWKVAYFPLVPDGTAAYPSATATVDGAYAYLFALYEKAGRPMLLTRVPLAGLDDPVANLQSLVKGEKKAGNWKRGFKPRDAIPVMDRGTSEMSVRYHPELKKWLAVMRSPDLSSDAILLRTAPALSRLSIEEGHATDADTVIRKCKEEFHQDGQADDELAASVALIDGLLGEDKFVEAAKEEQSSQALAAKSTNQLNRLQFDLVSARVELAEGHPMSARTHLERTLQAARAHHLLGIELETQLAVAELKKKVGQRVEAQADLSALEKLARGKGFGLTAGKALSSHNQ